MYPPPISRKSCRSRLTVLRNSTSRRRHRTLSVHGNPFQLVLCVCLSGRVRVVALAVAPALSPPNSRNLWEGPGVSVCVCECADCTATSASPSPSAMCFGHVMNGAVRRRSCRRPAYAEATRNILDASFLMTPTIRIQSTFSTPFLPRCRILACFWDVRCRIAVLPPLCCSSAWLRFTVYFSLCCTSCKLTWLIVPFDEQAPFSAMGNRGKKGICLRCF